MGDLPGPTLEQGIELVYNEVRKTHNVTKKLVTEICSQDYYEPPPGVSESGYQGSFGSAMGWSLGGCGKKDILVNKVIRHLTGEPEPKQKPIVLSPEKSADLKRWNKHQELLFEERKKEMKGFHFFKAKQRGN